MASLTATSIRRPVATMMVFLILIVLGIVSLRTLPVDLLPEVEFTQLTVRVQYPNVGPREIEQIITEPIENAVSGLPNLERVTSVSEEGSSRVRLDFARGTQIDEAANDLRAALDRLRDEFPVEAEPPEILKLDLDRIEVVSLAATSTHDLERLTHLLEEEVARRFEQIPGVGSIDLRGGIYREIRIDLDRDRLKAAGLTALDVQEAIGRENITLPGGDVKSGTSDLSVRAVGEYQSLEEIALTPVVLRDRFSVRVRDVANVRDGYEDASYLAEINGMPSVSMGIQKQSGANTVDVAAAIRAEAERINEQRDDIHLTVFADQSEFIRQSIAGVRNSALWGSLLAVLVLYAYLRNRAGTAIIAMAIPISVISSFALLYFGGQTLNQMTFGGLALGVGLIVDNSIVVLESIVRKREEGGLGAREAARIGTLEVTGAIVASTLTTCIIFLPVVFTNTTSGALFQSLALVVVFALACSLLVALTIVPMTAARLFRRPGGHERRTASRSIQRLEGWYTRRLEWALEHRFRVFAVTFGLLGIAMLLMPLIPRELAPQTEVDEIDVEIEMADGTNMAVVREYVDELEAIVRRTLRPGDVDLVSTEVRGGDAEVELKLAPAWERQGSTTELTERLRRATVGQIPGAEIEVDTRAGLWILNRVFSSGAGDDDIELEVRGWNLEQADRLAEVISRRMERIQGLAGVRVSRREGQPELRLSLDRQRLAELGLSAEVVTETVRANVGGVQAGRLRQGGDEYPIVVRLQPRDRLTRNDLQNISLRTPEGAVIPLSSVIVPQRGRSPLEIDHVDSQRVTYVTADLEGGMTLGEAVESVNGALADLRLPEGFAFSFGGQYLEQQRAQRDFTIAILMALALVYMLMAGQFERFLDPLIVMVAVPMALIGVVPTLLLTGTTLNMQSIMGLIMLIGIVVNNAIVLVDTINLLRRDDQHRSLAEAVIEAGRLRLRPILMTTTTTVLGLLPLAIGIGAGAEIQAALARTVIGGLIAATLVTLLLIPVVYITLTRIANRMRARLHGFGPGRAEREPERAATA